jgi:hypothetical protein
VQTKSIGKGVFYVPCCTHALNLLAKDLAKLRPVQEFCVKIAEVYFAVLVVFQLLPEPTLSFSGGECLP